MPMAQVVERKDTLFVLALLGGGAYAAYANWDAISAKLGLRELDPGLVKAIELTKKSYDFDSNTTNWLHLQTRARNDEILIDADPWSVERVSDWAYVVDVRWIERDQPVLHRFSVDNKTRTVRHQGPVEFTPVSPR